MKILAILLSSLLLVACGGGFDTAAYQQAIDAAVAKEAQARLLAVDTPCDQASQCGTVAFTDPRNQCGRNVSMTLRHQHSLI